MTRAEFYEVRGDPVPNGHEADPETLCQGCGEPFETTKANKRYCDEACRQRAKIERRKVGPSATSPNGSASTMVAVEEVVDPPVELLDAAVGSEVAAMVLLLVDEVGSLVLERDGWKIAVSR